MRRWILFALLLCCLLPGVALAAQSPAKAKAGSAARTPAGAQLLCPASAGLGEPFLVRVRSSRPGPASVGFLGRSAPVALRRAGAGWAGAVVLGADILGGRPGRQEVTLTLEGRPRRVLRAGIELTPVERPVESLTLDPGIVTPPASEYARIARERGLSQKALAQSGAERLWSLPLVRPVPGEVSSVYGVGRILNGVPKAPHRGLDLEAETGQPVLAAADGVVALAGSFYYAGNCVYLDHGQGLVTMYFHLSELRVAQGQRVARGELLGLAGDTGRSTRSHLHFGVSALGRLVDPAPLFLYDMLP